MSIWDYCQCCKRLMDVTVDHFCHVCNKPEHPERVRGVGEMRNGLSEGKLKCSATAVRPEQLRIVGKMYAVNLCAESPLDTRFLGRVDFAKGAISIQEGLVHDQAADTLLHEAIHCIDYAMHTDLEERQVHALAAGIYALLKDNPGLVSWLLS